MAARRQQTHAKRARELAVKEKRERKKQKKADRAAGLLPETEYENWNVNGDPMPRAEAASEGQAEASEDADEAGAEEDELSKVEDTAADG